MRTRVVPGRLTPSTQMMASGGVQSMDTQVNPAGRSGAAMGSLAVLRTPDERFADLPDFPYPPHYVDLPDLRIHYLDVGPADGPAVVLLHGEPSWSFLYRKMIPIFDTAGFRVVAPDLVGFGRSDKPVERSAYTYQRHVDWMWATLDSLALRDMTLVGQDWGGLIGL